MSLNLSKTFGLIRPMTRSLLLSTSTLTRFAVNSVEAALALDFIGSEYRTGNAATTFADAFMGNSPKLTYNPGSASSSQSTMVNSSGHLVWAPHNLVNYSDGSQAQLGGSNTTDAAAPIEGFSNSLYFNGDGTLSLKYFSGIPSGVLLTFSVYVELDNGEKPTFLSRPQAPFDFVIGGVSPSYGSGYTVTNVGGNVYQVSTTIISGSSGQAGIIQLTNQTTPFKATGWQCYRSDLGGMAQVPGAATGFEYYVPTNGNPEYLPRVGHHVYNGSAWVNEGLVIESEPRTNLVTYSEDFSHPSWTGGGFSVEAPDGTIAPDGVTVADKIVWTATTEYHSIFTALPASGSTTYTRSVFIKSAGHQWIHLQQYDPPASPTNRGVWFDIQNGVKGTEDTGCTGEIVDVGNGWYRCSVAYTTSAGATSERVQIAFTAGDGVSALNLTGDGTSGIYLWGAQLDQGEAIPNTNPVQYKDAPTPSSYIPTSGSTVTRGGQSLTVPPAEFGWPEPEVIGPELVTDFSTYADQAAFDVDWTRGTGWTFDANNDTAIHAAGSATQLTQSISMTLGKVYQATCDVVACSGGTGSLQFRGGGTTTVATIDVTDVGSSVQVTYVAEGNTQVAVFAGSGTDLTIDNISVREINPLSVSIQMDGRMTYADTGKNTSGGGQSGEIIFHSWLTNLGADYVETVLATGSTRTGEFVAHQRASTGLASEIKVDGVDTYFSPGVNVPFNISSRHGSTFIRGATDGVLTNLDTTPTALPDLSGTNLQIAKDFMGTIGTFRQFAGDIGDTGLVTATNPSTEPTLSLTFDGTGGSFYNLSWSE